MTHARFLPAALLCALLLARCDNFVQSIDPPIDSVEDRMLDSEEQIPFLINGVQAQFNGTYATISVLAGALSDELIFDRNLRTATFPTLEDLDRGTPALTNGDAEGAMTALGRLRLLADTLVARVGRITFSDSAVRRNALFNGYLYGGIARYFWAAYFGLEPERGGGVINNSPFIPSEAMYDLALENLQLAYDHAPDEYERRVVMTLTARIHLYRGQYATAAAALALGLQQGDPPMQALFIPEAANAWHNYAGAGRTQLVLDYRFNMYRLRLRRDSVRVPVVRLSGNSGSVFYRQNKYPEDKSPMPFLTWQENTLMAAEIFMRQNAVNEAVQAMNAVRGSYALPPTATDITLDTIYVERDKELLCTGNRLVDQRRFQQWHLNTGTWQFLPITQAERTRNPNLR